MAILNSSVGLIYTLSADTSKAESEVKKFSDTVDKETGDSSDSFSSLGNSIGGLGNALPVLGAVAAGITAVAAAAVGAGVMLFDLAKKTAETGAEIDKFQKLTGLTVENIGAIKVASEQAGSSLDEFEDSWESFIEKLIEGAKSAGDARDALVAAGIDPQKGFKDLDGSIKKALDSVANAKSTAESSAIAMNLFGESGLRVIGVAKEMGGSFDSYTRKLKEMGLATDEEGVRKSKEFDRQLKTTGMQIEGIGKIIAMEFMPIFLSATQKISDFLKENKDELKNWATDSTNFIKGLIVYWGSLKDKVAEFDTYVRKLGEDGYLGPKLPGPPLATNPMPTGAKDTIIKAGENSKEIGVVSTDADMYKVSQGSVGNPFGSYTPRDLEKEKADAEKEFQETLAGQERRDKAIEERTKAAFEKYQSILIESYKQRKIAAEKFNEDFLQSETRYVAAMLAAVEKEYDRKRAQTKNATVKEALKKEEENAKIKITDESFKRKEEVEKLSTETQKQESEKRVKQSEEEANRLISLNKKWTEAAIKESELFFAQKLISEEKHVQDVEKLKLRSFQFEKTQLARLEQTAEIKQRISDITAEMSIQTDEDALKTIDQQIEKNERYLEIKKQLVEAERELQDVLNAKERLIILDEIETSFGTKRLKALADLRDFDIAEAERQEEQRQDDLQADLEAALQRVENTENEEAQKELIIGLYREKALVSQAEFELRLQEIKTGFTGATKAETPTSGISQIGGMLGEVFGGQDQENLKLYTALGDTLTSTFNSMAQAVGNSVKAFVLFGSAGGSFRKFAAEMIASIAQMAAVQAVWNVAEGFAKLALAYFGHPAAGPSATQHFIAAGVYAGIAGVATVAGRAVAGNAFNKENSSSAVSSGVSSSSSSSGNRSVAGAFSGYRDEVRIIEQGRNQPQTLQQELTLRLDSGGVLQVVKDSIRSNGDMRSMILEVVEGG